MTALRPSPVRALFYLYGRTFRNRLARQVRRLRDPRYVVAVLLGALYVWWFVLRGASRGGAPISRFLGSEITLVVGSTLLLLTAARWWLFGSDRGALAFTPAEIQFLFPAPITRRGLIHTKLLRLQLAILLNTTIFTVILRGDLGSLASWQRALGLWVFFSTVTLHRLGASIVRSSAMDHGRAGARRGLLPVLLFGGLLTLLLAGLVAERAPLQLAAAEGVIPLIKGVTSALMTPMPSYALGPARLVLEPVIHAGTSIWWHAIGPALLLLLLHYAWVIRLDRAFEEASMEATQRRVAVLQRMRNNQMRDARSSGGKLVRIPRLALRGRPELAIVWKNIAAALRGGSWRSQLVTFTVSLAIMAVTMRAISPRAGEAFIGVTVGWGMMLLFLGPLWMRFDLRLDLPRLAMLKTMPLPGWRIVLAEITAVTILHSITVWSLMTVPIVMFLQDPRLFLESGATVPMLLATAIGVPVFNALMFTIQNGTALLFPAWVRLGTESRGFETMGQSLLTTGATTLVAAVALVFPVGTGVLTLWLAGDWSGWTLLLAIGLSSVVIALELWPVMVWLGNVFDELEVSEVAATG